MRSLTPIFITRFIIRIRQVDERGTVITTVSGLESTTGQDSAVVFATRDQFLDSMRGELGDDSDEDASALDAGPDDVDGERDNEGCDIEEIPRDIAPAQQDIGESS